MIKKYDKNNIHLINDVNGRVTLITLDMIQTIHKNVLEIDKYDNPDDHICGELCISVLEMMFEHKISNQNTVFKNAAIAMYSIVVRHPFYNGNKRTGYETARIILDEEGYRLKTTVREKVEFTVSLAMQDGKFIDEEALIEQITTWLKKHSVKKRTKQKRKKTTS